MPPKAKYSKQEIIEKAVEIISTEGMDKLTARELAGALGTSAKPIFTAFENMEDVKQECFNYAFEKYHAGFANGLGDKPFMTIGKIFIEFAQKEPRLFQVIFMQSQDREIPFAEYMKKLDDSYSDTLLLLEREFGIKESQAEELYKNMWIYSTGIATLCATRQCSFTTEEIDRLLDISCKGIIHELRKN